VCDDVLRLDELVDESSQGVSLSAAPRFAELGSRFTADAQLLRTEDKNFGAAALVFKLKEALYGIALNQLREMPSDLDEVRMLRRDVAEELDC
jgi:hypothetical protein